MAKFWRRKFYGELTFDEYMELERALYHLGLLSNPGDYGRATCLNCRAVVSVGYERVALKYAKQHRLVCGSAHLHPLLHDEIADQLAEIGRP